MKTIKLFCFPNAGGTAFMYAPWKKHLDPAILLCPIELAGRGRRFQEPLYTDFAEAVEDVYGLVVPQLDGSPFAFFGHSMGALLCYEVIASLWQECRVVPLHAFLSGRTPPATTPVREPLHLLSDAALADRLIEWGGISKQLLANRSFMSTFLPIIRADLEMVETYRRPMAAVPVPCALSLLAGEEDPLAQMEHLRSWREYTTHSCSFHVFPGDHFYLLEDKQAVIALINTTLCPVVGSELSSSVR